MRNLLLPLALLGVAGAAGAAGAQQTQTCPNGTGVLASGTYACEQNAQMGATVSDVLELTLTRSAVNLGTPTKANYGALQQNAYLATTTPLDAASSELLTVAVKANRSYRVNLMTTASTFTYTAPTGGPGFNDPQKPSTDLFFTASNLRGSSPRMFNNGDVTTINRMAMPVTATTNTPGAFSNGSNVAILYNLGGTSDDRVDVAFSTRWAYERDVPGTYTLVGTFVLATR